MKSKKVINISWACLPETPSGVGQPGFLCPFEVHKLGKGCFSPGKWKSKYRLNNTCNVYLPTSLYIKTFTLRSVFTIGQTEGLLP